MEVRVISETKTTEYASKVAKACSEMESKLGIFVSLQHAMAQGSGGTVYYSAVLVWRLPDAEPEPEPETLLKAVNHGM